MRGEGAETEPVMRLMRVLGGSCGLQAEATRILRSHLKLACRYEDGALASVYFIMPEADPTSALPASGVLTPDLDLR